MNAAENGNKPTQKQKNSIYKNYIITKPLVLLNGFNMLYNATITILKWFTNGLH
jgi:hypothetical protein